MALNLKTNGRIRGRLALEDITADRTLTSEDTGKTFLMDTVGEDITIPAAALGNRGVNYTFVCAVKCDNTTPWTVTSGATDIHLQISSGGTNEADRIAAGTVQASVDFVKNLADEGDHITMFSTGTFWIMHGAVHAKANLTMAT